MRQAMYAFSGDPITYGHIDIISRASNTFDRVVVGIGINPDKKYMFSLDERQVMAQKSLASFSNVEVVSFQGLLVDYAYEHGIDVIVKGVRNAADFDYESVLHEVGKSQKFGIDTHILFARPELAHISSSVVKGVQKEQGLIREYVTPYVKQCLEERISKQYIIGITGEVGAGKSYIADSFVRIGSNARIQVHNLDLDRIGHQILGELKEPAYEETRKTIAKTFGDEVRHSDGTINRAMLGELVFADKKKLETLNHIMETPLLTRLRRELYGKTGLILVNAALIADLDMTYLCNNNMILVYADKSTQKKRLINRDLAPEQIRRRVESQYSFTQKRERINANIKRDSHGNHWVFDNSDGISQEDIKRFFDTVVKDMGF